MKTLTIIFIIALSVNVHAQIKGNGNISTSEYQLEAFTRIDNGLSSIINVVIGDSHEIRIKTDKNLQNQIRVEIQNGVLSINQKEWISSSSKIQIEITTKDLIEFRNSAHGKYTITGIDTDRFSVDANVGEFELSGTAKSFVAKTKVGFINAFELQTESAELEVQSFGSIKINTAERLYSNVSTTGSIVYTKKPSIVFNEVEEGGRIITVAEDESPKAEVKYVDLKLKNNSLKRVNIVFEGPEHAQFGYGTRFILFQTRAERFPVGTKIYEKLSGERRKLLLVIEANDEDKTLKLFN